MQTVKYILTLFLAGTSTWLMAQVGEDSELYQTIARLDSIYFDAYNTCDMATQAEMYDEDLEFYHDMGGLSTNKQDILKSIEQNICGKVTRELVPESIEVYPIPGFGALEMAKHKFHNKEEPNAESRPSKFIVLWKETDNGWKISRVVSLH